MKVLRIVAMLVLAAALDFSAPLLSEARDVSEEVQEASHGARRRQHQYRVVREAYLSSKTRPSSHESIQPPSRSTSVRTRSLASDHHKPKVPPSSADSDSPSDDH